MSRWYDVSLPLASGSVSYPGNPEILVTPWERIADGAGANVSALAMGSHSGTHVDSARHFSDDGEGVDAIPIERLVGPALLLSFPDTVRRIGAEDLRAQTLNGHTRILLRTRNSALLRDPVFVRDYTYLTPDGATFLVDQGVQLVGIDYYSVEQFHSGHHGAHHALLDHGVTIVEGLDLHEPPAGPCEFVCLPLRLSGLDGAPARAILRPM